MMSRRKIDESADSEWERSWSQALEQRVRDVANHAIDLIDADDVHRELRHEVAELKRRAADALRGQHASYSREESVARARAAVDAIRSRKP